MLYSRDHLIISGQWSDFPQSRFFGVFLGWKHVAFPLVSSLGGGGRGGIMKIKSVQDVLVDDDILTRLITVRGSQHGSEWTFQRDCKTKYDIPPSPIVFMAMHRL
jgi:hypothetical protein